MAEETNTVPMDDKELFASATADEPKQEAPVEAKEPAEGDRPRDELGRFAPKEDKPEVQAEQPPTQSEPTEPKEDQAQVPPWRLRELREAREAAERRAQEYERELAFTRQQYQQMQRELQSLKQPQTAHDPFTNPEEFRDQGVQKALDPVQQRLDQMREFYSQNLAVTKHGQQVVQDAYNAMGTALRSGDPEAAAVYQRAMNPNSLDPYGAIVTWHTQRSVLSKIGNDPDAWFEKTLDERAKDPAFQAKLLERIRGTAPHQSQNGRPNIQMPPSLNKVTGSGANSGADDGDMSDAALFRYAASSGR